MARALLSLFLLLWLLPSCNAMDRSDTAQRSASEDKTAAASPEYAEEEERTTYNMAASPKSGATKDTGNFGGEIADALLPTTRKPEPKEPEANAPSRMMVYKAWLHLASHQVDETLAEARAITLASGGFIESSSQTELVLRIPAAEYEATYAVLRKLGEIRHERVTSHDITEQYTNLAARIENLKALKLRYETLLAQATSMEERLAIERELLRITSELSVLQERLAYLADQAAFATVTLNVERIQPQHLTRNRPAQPFPWVQRHGIASLYAE